MQIYIIRCEVTKGHSYICHPKLDPRPHFSPSLPHRSLSSIAATPVQVQGGVSSHVPDPEPYDGGRDDIALVPTTTTLFCYN